MFGDVVLMRPALLRLALAPTGDGPEPTGPTALSTSHARREAEPVGRLVVIDLDECHELLRSQVVGRLAFVTPEGPDVVPVNYALVDGSLHVRTAAGRLRRPLDEWSDRQLRGGRRRPRQLDGLERGGDRAGAARRGAARDDPAASAVLDGGEWTGPARHRVRDRHRQEAPPRPGLTVPWLSAPRGDVVDVLGCPGRQIDHVVGQVDPGVGVRDPARPLLVERPG